MSNRYRLLFVDDEERVLRALKSIFRRQYDVYTATNGLDALEILSNQAIDVIVSDQRMPAMGGNELLAFVRDQHPRVVRILLTGYVDKATIVDTINRGEIYRYISKPWNIEEMKAIIADAAKASRKTSSQVYSQALKSSEAFIAKRVMDDAVKSRIKTVREHAILNAQEEAIKSRKEPAVMSMEQECVVEPQQGSNETTDVSLLIIDQDQRLRNSARHFSRQFGLAVYSAPSLIQAARILSMRPDIGLLVLGLSADSGETLGPLTAVKRSRPDLVVIALADLMDSDIAIRLINEGQVFRYLQKPVDSLELESTLLAGIKHHHMLKKVDTLTANYQVEGLNSGEATLGPIRTQSDISRSA